jgi:hypothetical protein
MSDIVRIVEVGPRDGLQNEKTLIGVAERIAFVEALIGAGHRGRRLRVAQGDPADDWFRPGIARRQPSGGRIPRVGTE